MSAEAEALRGSRACLDNRVTEKTGVRVAMGVTAPVEAGVEMADRVGMVDREAPALVLVVEAAVGEPAEEPEALAALVAAEITDVLLVGAGPL